MSLTCSADVGDVGRAVLLFASLPRRSCPDLLNTSLLSRDITEEEEGGEKEDECVT